MGGMNELDWNHAKDVILMFLAGSVSYWVTTEIRAVRGSIESETKAVRASIEDLNNKLAEILAKHSSYDAKNEFFDRRISHLENLKKEA